MKKLLLILALAPSLAYGAIQVRGTIGYSIDEANAGDAQVTSDGSYAYTSGTGKTTTTVSKLEVGYRSPFGFKIGGALNRRALDFGDSDDSSLDADETILAFGIWLGWQFTNLSFDFNHYISASNEFTTGGTTFDADGSGMDFGVSYTFPITAVFSFGPRLVYHTFSFDEWSANGIDGTFDPDERTAKGLDWYVGLDFNF